MSFSDLLITNFFQPAREMLKLQPSIFRDYGDYSQLKLRREVSLNSQARPWPEASNNNKFAVFTLKNGAFMLLNWGFRA